jgi:hypothetical protein
MKMAYQPQWRNVNGESYGVSMKQSARKRHQLAAGVAAKMANGSAHLKIPVMKAGSQLSALSSASKYRNGGYQCNVKSSAKREMPVGVKSNLWRNTESVSGGKPGWHYLSLAYRKHLAALGAVALWQRRCGATLGAGARWRWRRWLALAIFSASSAWQPSAFSQASSAWR